MYCDVLKFIGNPYRYVAVIYSYNKSFVNTTQCETRDNSIGYFQNKFYNHKFDLF